MVTRKCGRRQRSVPGNLAVGGIVGMAWLGWVVSVM